MNTAPLLSIGMIFKNEKRCLERCLRSLQPLRDAIPCELVMADTGSDDGSRAIAEQYADEVFDFPWIDDFAAARNAVINHCHSKWYFSVDSDEWLDADISELLSFLKDPKGADSAFVMQRNYETLDLEKGEHYNDFHAARLLWLPCGRRFTGAIHEQFGYNASTRRLLHTVLHHDGYVYTTPDANKKKSWRNLKLLLREQEKNPGDTRTLMQIIESGRLSPDYTQYIRQGVAAVQAQYHGWDIYGPCILRHAVNAAQMHELPELEEWTEYAEKQFPDSVFTKVDLYYSVFLAAHSKKDWKRAIRYGEAYRKGLRVLRASRRSAKLEAELGRSSLMFGSKTLERDALIGLSDVYLQDGQAEKALLLLMELDGERLTPEQVRMTVVAYFQLHAQSELDIAPAFTDFYEQIARPQPDEAARKSRLDMFTAIAAVPFTEAHQKEEQEKDGYWRPSSTLLRCLAGQCEAGRAAAILTASGPDEIRECLLRVEDWQALPIEALEHALRVGVTFPMPEKALPIEVLDGLAAKLPRGSLVVRRLVIDLPGDARQYPDLQSLFWAQALTLATLRSFKWSLFAKDPQNNRILSEEPIDEDLNEQTPEEYTKEGFTLLRRFAQVEDILLPMLYTPGMLREENAALLPPMHRWGLYCSRALNALDGGRPQEYLALLRKGLKACPGEKEMIQFMLDRFVETTRPKASSELLALAEQVRKILSAYDPNDPAVEALKATPAYQQVAWIIEDSNAGGLPS